MSAAPPSPAPPKSGVPVSPGDVIADKYVVERVIGAGGVGVVVAASHKGLGDRVAIKLLQRSALESAENLERFKREARALARIKCENVARVMDTGALETGEPFMVMELLEGQDLAAVLRTRGKLPVVEAIDFVVQACEAIAVAHAANIVHRDVKPANLFLSRAVDGTPIVKVLDFGISKLREVDSKDQAMTQTLSVIGSPLYMSPEQMERPRDADERSDIWSLGVITYELITGKPPFEAATMPMLCARICTAPPIPFADREVELPSDLSSAVLRCLEKDPAQRFLDVAAFAAAIAPFGYASTRVKAARIERILRHDANAPEVSAQPDDGAPDSTGPRRLAWDSSPPPPLHVSETVRPRRRLRFSTLAVVVASVALGALLWFGQPGDPLPVASVAAASLRSAQQPTGSSSGGSTLVTPVVDVPAAPPEAPPPTTTVSSAPLTAPATTEPSALPRPTAQRPKKPAPKPRLDDVLSER